MLLSKYAHKIYISKNKYVVFNSLLLSPIIISGDEMRQIWKYNLTINKDYCLRCPAIYICGGGCPKQAEDIFGFQTKIDKPFCIYTKYTFKELFLRSIKKSQQ